MSKPLQGIKVLELGNFVAAPFAGKLFAEFGAEVIKIEDPTKGDALRNWRIMHEGTSLWWYVHARNKKSVTINLREKEGQELVRELAKDADVIIENFRPGTLEKWGIGYEDLKKVNSSIIMARISGYGQTGPYRDKAGFGSVAESIGGLRYITGDPDRPPVRMGVAIGDSVSALYAVIGTLMALRARDSDPEQKGQVIDIALYESVFSLMEGMLPEFDLKGVVRERTGSILKGIAPSNTYPTLDGKYIIIGANGDSIFKRLMQTMGMPELGEDTKYSSNQGRADNVDFLDNLISEWTKKQSLNEVQKKLDEAGVPAGPIYSIEDIANDEHYKARNMLETVTLPTGERVKVPGIVPKLSGTPGGIEWIGPQLGQHNEEVIGNKVHGSN
ncbi:CaiB/BaiF CoA transferase family protein [Bacillus sp. FJAT-45350]|uniref:CaiB/BaiF CoA transferase family protein n=1 Tax=Bacillus sp. FJAT-45350 TaxID=2011014 RepID=UPI000BB7F71E|nr:CoA transferase [Bacillus sp. FJAT-45350]